MSHLKFSYMPKHYALNGLLCLATLLFNSTSHAASRCVNGAHAVVAYVDNAQACPVGTQFKGDVMKAAHVNDADRTNAETQAARDIDAANALDAQAVATANANIKAQLAAQKQQASHDKHCQTATLALERMKNKADDVANNHSAKPKRSKASKHSRKKNSQQSDDNAPQVLTHTVVRDEDGKPNKAKQKSLHKLEAAQAKRDLACR